MANYRQLNMFVGKKCFRFKRHCVAFFPHMTLRENHPCEELFIVYWNITKCHESNWIDSAYKFAKPRRQFIKKGF